MLIPRGLRLAATPLALIPLLVACPFAPPNGTVHDCVTVGTNGYRPPSKAPYIWLGTVDDNGNYRGITQGETQPVQYGSQGGSHVWAAVDLYAAGGSADWTLRFQIKAADPNVGPAFSTLVAFEDLVPACDTDLAESRRVTVRFIQDPLTITSGPLMVDGSPDGGKTTVHAEVPIAWK